MRSAIGDVLPFEIRRALVQMGADISLARKKRSLMVMMMAERLGVAKSTYLKIRQLAPLRVSTYLRSAIISQLKVSNQNAFLDEFSKRGAI